MSDRRAFAANTVLFSNAQNGETQFRFSIQNESNNYMYILIGQQLEVSTVHPSKVPARNSSTS